MELVRIRQMIRTILTYSAVAGIWILTGGLLEFMDVERRVRVG